MQEEMTKMLIEIYILKKMWYAVTTIFGNKEF